MLDDIGNKLKTLAKGLLFIGIAVCAISAIVLFVNSLILVGFIVLIAGSISSVCTSFVLYGFGEIIVILQNINSKQNENIKETHIIKSAFSKAEKESTKPITHKWRCLNCNEMISENPCPFCGNDSEAIE